jgi:hypothetical protein
MPLIISKAGDVQYVKYAETLAEILEHGNFDGEDWAIGDRIIFENGTESRIQQEPGERFHVWDEPTTANLEEVKRAVKVPDAANWEEAVKADAAGVVG